MNKYTRSFSGAFLGSASAIWPAATWDMAILLLFGGTAGWLLGYHGDRLIRSIVRGYVYARRIGFKLFLERMFFANAIVLSSIVGALRHVVQFVNYVAPWFRSVFLKPIPFAKWGRMLLMIFMAVKDGIIATPGMFVRWYMQHPINRASVFRFFAGVSNAIITTMFFWWLTESGQRPGDIIMEMNKPIVLTVNGIFVEHVAATGLLTVLLVLATTFVFNAELNTNAGYYGVWNRYECLGKTFFFLEEIVRFQCFELWLVSTLFVGIVCSMVTLLVWSFLITPTYFGVVYAFRLAWRTVRLNRDYGIISLGVSLITGAVTFFTLHEELVSDSVFRLSVSLMAGLAAGLASMALTWFCGVMFGKSLLMRRIALKKVYVERGPDMSGLTEKVLPYIWKHWKLLLPSRIRAGCAAF